MRQVVTDETDCGGIKGRRYTRSANRFFGFRRQTSQTRKKTDQLEALIEEKSCEKGKIFLFIDKMGQSKNLCGA